MCISNVRVSHDPGGLLWNRLNFRFHQTNCRPLLGSAIPGLCLMPPYIELIWIASLIPLQYQSFLADHFGLFPPIHAVICLINVACDGTFVILAFRFLSAIPHVVLLASLASSICPVLLMEIIMLQYLLCKT